jgi:hypothetical protein
MGGMGRMRRMICNHLEPAPLLLECQLSWERFQSADSWQRGGGSGTGLKCCRKICESRTAGQYDGSASKD